MGVSRRGFLKLGLAAAVGAVIGDADALIIPKPHSFGEIDFYQAYAHPQLRQTYLETLLEKFPGKVYVDKIIYDSNAKIVQRDLQIVTRNSMCSKEFMELVASSLSVFPELQKYAGLNGNQQEILSILEEECKDTSKQEILAQKIDKVVGSLPLVNQAITLAPILPQRYGSGEKSSIYILGDCFEDQFYLDIPIEKRKEMHLSIRCRVNDEWMSSVLVHELKHAEHVYKGISLANGMIITSSTEASFDIMKFLDELEAYNAGIRYAQKTNTSSLTMMCTTLGKFLAHYNLSLPSAPMDGILRYYADERLNDLQKEFPLIKQSWEFYRSNLGKLGALPA